MPSILPKQPPYKYLDPLGGSKYKPGPDKTQLRVLRSLFGLILVGGNVGLYTPLGPNSQDWKTSLSIDSGTRNTSNIVYLDTLGWSRLLSF